MRMLSGLLMISSIAALAAPAAASPCKPHALGFDDGEWRHLPLSALKKDTRYSVTKADGKTVLQAEADSSASLYGTPLSPALTTYKLLSWQWQTDALVRNADNRDKQREDAPVRLVAAFGGDQGRLSDAEKRRLEWAQSLSKREPPYAALMYIWSEQLPRETVIPSAHTSQLKMLVVASGSREVGKWQNQRRDLRADYKRAFGEEPGALLGIGVMTDTDNTGAKVSARYADIRLQCGK